MYLRIRCDLVLMQTFERQFIRVEALMKRVPDLPKVEALQVSIAHAGDDAPACVAVQTR